MASETTTPQEELEQPHPEKNLGLLAWVNTLILAAGFYILSVGPASLLLAKGMVSRASLHSIYAPLKHVHDGVPWFGKVLEWYCELWV